MIAPLAFVVAVQDDGADSQGVGTVTAICARTPGESRHTVTRIYVEGGEHDGRERIAGLAARTALDEALIAEGLL